MKYKELFELLHKDDWIIIRQRVSHVIMEHPIKADQLSVPNHSGKEVKKGLVIIHLKEGKY